MRQCFISCLLVVCGCAGGGGSIPGDSGLDDVDGGRRRDSGPSCPDGQHACGGGCVDDQPNDPSRGCRLGCGEPCDPPEGATASCSSDGSCSFECAPPFVPDGERCACMPMTCEAAGSECGTTDDGCGGTIECGSCSDGSNCVDHACECSPGLGEPNESPTAAVSLGEFRDSEDREEIIALYAITSDSDVDWFELRVIDACCASNPHLQVGLAGIPSGSNYDLAVYYTCDSGGGPPDCAAGTPDTAMGGGCLSESSGNMPEAIQLDTSCDGINENGTAFIRVRAATWGGMCGVYRLTVRVT